MDSAEERHGFEFLDFGYYGMKHLPLTIVGPINATRPVLVLVGAMVDELIVYSCATLGIALPFQFAVACVVAVWIVCNEFISILENLKDMGTNIPAFMIPLIRNVRSQAEGKIIVKEEEENDAEKESD